MPVRNHLAGSAAARTETHSVNHIVYATLELFVKFIYGTGTFDIRSFFNIVGQLSLCDPIRKANFLFFNKLGSVFRRRLWTARARKSAFSGGRSKLGGLTLVVHSGT